MTIETVRRLLHTRALGDSDPRSFSRNSRSSLSAGDSGRLRETEIASLPTSTDEAQSNLEVARENREILCRSYACAGARARARPGGATRSLGLPNPPSLPPSGTMLRLGRCVDCRHWPTATHDLCGLRKRLSALCEDKVYDPGTWHYCKHYGGSRRAEAMWVVPGKKGTTWRDDSLRRRELSGAQTDLLAPCDGESGERSDCNES